MSKRKAESGLVDAEKDDDIVNVDFEWFDPKEIDFEGIKLLLRQLFDTDNQIFNLSSICNLILAQPLGSTVKVSDDDGKTEETDPYAFLSLLNLHEHRNDSAVKTLMAYLTSKSSQASLASLPDLLSPNSTAKVGLVLSERFINMPVEIVPPMYDMLLEEMDSLVKEFPDRSLSHYLIVSKTYAEVAPESESAPLGAPARTPAKKQKQGKDSSPQETFLFHAEDETFQRFATEHGAFAYTHQDNGGVSDARRVFQDAGITPSGHLILLTADQFVKAVETLRKQFAN